MNIHHAQSRACVPSVLHVASGDLWAGAETQIFNLLRCLSRRHDVRCTAALLNNGELADRLRDCGIDVHILDERSLSFAALLTGLCRLVRAIRPDIVHTHRAKENLLGALAAKCSMNAVSLRTVHGGPESGSDHSWSLRRDILALLERSLVAPMQKCVVAVAEPLAEQLAVTMPSHKVRAILNGIDISETRAGAARSSAFNDPDRIGICFAGRLVQVKRVDVFLEAARLVLHQHPGRYVFYIIGDGPLRGNLEALRRKLDLESTCIFTGFLPDPLPLLGSMSALVMTSDHEGTPMIALESLALGVPIVAHAVGGLVRLIQRPAQGRLVEIQDPAAFAKAILAVARPQSEPMIGRDSLLSSEYSIQHCADAHVSLYREILDER